MEYHYTECLKSAEFAITVVHSFARTYSTHKSSGGRSVPYDLPSKEITESNISKVSSFPSINLDYSVLVHILEYMRRIHENSDGSCSGD